jgi:hypothetical protein
MIVENFREYLEDLLRDGYTKPSRLAGWTIARTVRSRVR